MLSENIHDYYYVSQGKTTIPGMDDGEEFQLTDVRAYEIGRIRNFLGFLVHFSSYRRFVEMLGILAQVDDVD